MIFTTKKHSVESFLIERGAKKYPHVKNGSLYDHLLRVADLLRSWDVSEDVIYAGMLHSIYSTEFFREKIVSISERDQVKKLVGNESEALIFHYRNLIRDSIKRTPTEGFSYKSRDGGSLVDVPKDMAAGLLAILLSNELDHITVHNHGYHASSLGWYGNFFDLLPIKAQEQISTLISPATGKRNNTSANNKIQFIAHAGIMIQARTKTVLIDPWIYPSTFENPILRGIDPEAKTIDFIVPVPQTNINDIECDVILLSHFHTHHSPLREIRELAQRRKITIICPQLDGEKMTKIAGVLGKEIFDQITFTTLNSDSEILIDDITICVMTHPQKNHFAFFVKSRDVSVLHIADARYNSDHSKNQEGDEWKKFYHLKPDYLFIGAAPASLQVISKDGRDIIENTTLTPIQAAKLTRKILPKQVTLIGMDNFSVWCNRIEYRLHAEEASSQFYWAVSYLAPAVQMRKLYPGQSV